MRVVATAAFALAVAAVVMLLIPAPVSAAIPSRFFTVTDQQGANDEPGQKDLTQMGRDDSDPNVYKIFWSWDSTSLWAGTGQTGDACGLFDSDADGFINFAVCAQIANATSVAPPTQVASSPYVFTCSNKRVDRCTGATSLPFTSTLVQAGVLGNPLDVAGSLLTNTDPFPDGDEHPLDATVQINISKLLLPNGSILVNVCSYPSIALGGNNDPSDCIGAPGGGFVVIEKVAHGDGSATFGFTVSPVSRGTTSGYEIVGSGETDEIGVPIGTSVTATELLLPTEWRFDSASCRLANGAPTGTADAQNRRVTNVTVESGLVTRCVFVNTELNPALLLDKKASTATYAAAGETIAYSYVVTNTGNVRLPGPVTVADDKAAVTCPALTTVGNGDAYLDPLESITCSASYSITQADVDAGSVTNVARANAGGAQSNQDTETVTAMQGRSLLLDKNAAPATYAAVGDTIVYRYVVTNTGNVSLVGPVAVADDKTTVVCPAVTTVGDGDGLLAPGESLTCSATYSITQADLDNESVTNVATAAVAGTESNTDAETVNGIATRALLLDKTAAPSTYSRVGETIEYGYLVTNTGNVRLSGPVAVADDKTTVTCPATSSQGNGDEFLDPNEKLLCKASYAITQADLDSGSVTNTARASIAGVDSNEDFETVNAMQHPALLLEKTAASVTYDTVGQTLSYSYLVTNTGNVRLGGPVTVDDDRATVGCPDVHTVGNEDGFLDPNESLVCSASYLVTQADLDAGSITNVARAAAAGVESNEDTATVAAVQERRLVLKKKASATTYSTAGSTMSYAYVVTNTGNVRLAGPVSITDDKVPVTCPALASVGNEDAFLDPDESITCTASHTITQADLNSGSITNVARANVGGTKSNDATETVSATTTRALVLAKTASSERYSDVGQTITFTLVAKNTGNVSLTNVAISDPKLGALRCTPAQPATLAPNETLTCTGNHRTTQADLDAGKYENTGCVGASGVSSVCADRTVTADQQRALSLVKAASQATYSAVGQSISYTYLVRNTGNVRLAGPVTVTDDKATVACPSVNTVGNRDGFLDVGEQITCTASYSITQADLQNASVTNTARATTGGTVSNEARATVTFAPLPIADAAPLATAAPAAPAAAAAPLIDLAITKADAPDPATVGGILRYTLTVTNNGPNDATGVTVADALPPQVTFVSASTPRGTCAADRGVVTCNVGSVAVGATVAITIVVRPNSPGAIINEAVVAGAEMETNPADNRAQAPTLVQGPPRPSVARCPTLRVQPRSTIALGRKTTLIARTTLAGRGVGGVRITVRGPGINRTRTTAASGTARITIQPQRVGIVQIRMSNQPTRCNTSRIGIVGVFRPSVTG